MTDDEPQQHHVTHSVDWKAIGLGVGVVAAIVGMAWLTWSVITFLFGTTLGRAIVGLTVMAAALYAILTDDEFDPNDALKDGPELSQDGDDEDYIGPDGQTEAAEFDESGGDSDDSDANEPEPSPEPPEADEGPPHPHDQSDTAYSRDRDQDGSPRGIDTSESSADSQGGDDG